MPVHQQEKDHRQRLNCFQRQGVSLSLQSADSSPKEEFKQAFLIKGAQCVIQYNTMTEDFELRVQDREFKKIYEEVKKQATFRNRPSLEQLDMASSRRTYSIDVFDPNDDSAFEEVLRDVQKESTGDKMADLLEGSKFFWIKDMKFEFNPEDKIFHISGPIEPRKQLKRCLPCDYAFTNKKQMVFCQFCGVSACGDCTKKTRIFPACNIDPEVGKRTSRGVICKLCDRKFMVSGLVQNSIKQIEMQNTVIKDVAGNIANQMSELNKEQARHEEEHAKTR